MKDANGQKSAYVYFENTPGRPDLAKLLTYDEARQIGVKHREAAGAREAVMNWPGLAPATHLLGIVGGGLWSCAFPSILLSP